MFKNYDPEKYDPTVEYDLIPEGEHVLRVESAEWTVSKSSGKDMIKMILSAEGYASRIFHYFVDNEYLQKNLDRFYASFGLPPGNFNLQSWIRLRGKARVKHEESNFDGSTQHKVGYFIPVKADEKAGNTSPRRPASRPAGMPEAAEPPADEDYPMDFSELELPDQDVPLPECPF